MSKPEGKADWTLYNDLGASLAGAAGTDAARLALLEVGTGRRARPVDLRSPQYTRKARRKGTEGTIVLRILVDKQGRAAEVEVLREAADGLTKSVVSAARKSKFQPATVDGKPVAGYYNLSVNMGIADG